MTKLTLTPGQAEQRVLENLHALASRGNPVGTRLAHLKTRELFDRLEAERGYRPVLDRVPPRDA